jgi:hypothetical protein
VNCLDCCEGLDIQRPAVAVCPLHNAAVCFSHAVVRLLKTPVGPGSANSPARTVTCLVCGQAGMGSVAEQAMRAIRPRRWLRGLAQPRDEGEWPGAR